MAELWRAIPRYEGFYEASDEGRIRNTRTGKVLRAYVQSGYPAVSLHKEGTRACRQVHVIVLEAFKGPRPNGYVGAHLDGQVFNSRIDNLSWVTPAENERHKKLHHTASIGTKSPHAKFAALQIKIIREAHSLGLSTHKIAALTGASAPTIQDIVNGKSYADVETKPASAVANGDAPSDNPLTETKEGSEHV